jgi:two-component system sensor histidine kinase KdpD
LGAEVLRVQDTNIASAIIKTAKEKDITTVCIGKPHISLFGIILRTNVFSQLLKTLSSNEIDLVILS